MAWEGCACVLTFFLVSAVLPTSLCSLTMLSTVQVVKVAGVSLWALFREKKEKPRN